MGLKKILKKLSNLLDDADSNDCSELKELLEKLEKKQKKIQRELEQESSGSKRKSLKLDLKITEAQLKKGEKLKKKTCR